MGGDIAISEPITRLHRAHIGLDHRTRTQDKSRTLEMDESGGWIAVVLLKEMSFQPATKDGQRLCGPDVGGQCIPPLRGQDREEA